MGLVRKKRLRSILFFSISVVIIFYEMCKLTRELKALQDYNRPGLGCRGWSDNYVWVGKGVYTYRPYGGPKDIRNCKGRNWRVGKRRSFDKLQMIVKEEKELTAEILAIDNRLVELKELKDANNNKIETLKHPEVRDLVLKPMEADEKAIVAECANLNPEKRPKDDYGERFETLVNCEVVRPALSNDEKRALDEAGEKFKAAMSKISEQKIKTDNIIQIMKEKNLKHFEWCNFLNQPPLRGWQLKERTELQRRLGLESRVNTLGVSSHGNTSAVNSTGSRPYDVSRRMFF